MANDLDFSSPADPHSMQTADIPSIEATQRMPIPAGRVDATAFEAKGSEGLADTNMRAVPEPADAWDQPYTYQGGTPDTPRFPLPTALLVGVVGAVCFVAGGFTARLSSQMPILFQNKGEAVEAKSAHADKPYQPVAEEEGQPEEDVSCADPQEEAPTYDRTQDWGTTTQDWGNGSAPEDEGTYRWDFDSEGDRSLSYDETNDRVTFDYDGYTFSLDLDGLLGDPDATGTDTYVIPYDYGTGYDTEEDRDYYQWNRRDYGESPRHDGLNA